MKGTIRYYTSDVGEETEETEFYFKREDVRSMCRTGDKIEVFLFGQGIIKFIYDAELHKKLVDLF